MVSFGVRSSPSARSARSTRSRTRRPGAWIASPSATRELGTNTTSDGNNTDCNGHGTHVTGTVGGSRYGVAKTSG